MATPTTRKLVPLFGMITLTVFLGYLSTVEDFPREHFTSIRGGLSPNTERYTIDPPRYRDDIPHSAFSEAVTIIDDNPALTSLRGAAKEEQTVKETSLDDSVPHRMCACVRCYDVRCSFNKTGHLSVAVRNILLGPATVTPDSGDDVSYFHVTVTGRDSISATIVSDLDRRMDTLPPIREEEGGTYNISLRLIHANRSSAYGLDVPQWRELNCPMCLDNSTCFLLMSGTFPRIPPEERRSFRWVRDYEVGPEDKSCASYGDVCYRFVPNKLDASQDSWHFNRSAEECFRSRKFAFLGDSHTGMFGRRLAAWPKENGWPIRMDGIGIYVNLSPRKNLTAFLAREIPSVFQEGGMLQYLSEGKYQNMQDKENFDGWIFSSGHWDLRDVTIDEYLIHLRQLFVEWNRFREANGNVLLYWNGVPPYSFHRDSWAGLEKRTNIKLALGDVAAKGLCAEFNISYIPFFDIALPFYSDSCDTHHYLCPGRASPIGEAQLDVLLRTICK